MVDHHVPPFSKSGASLMYKLDKPWQTRVLFRLLFPFLPIPRKLRYVWLQTKHREASGRSHICLPCNIYPIGRGYTAGHRHLDGRNFHAIDSPSDAMMRRADHVFTVWGLNSRHGLAIVIQHDSTIHKRNLGPDLIFGIQPLLEESWVLLKQRSITWCGEFWVLW